MDPIVFPISWQNVYSFINTCLTWAQNIQFTVIGGANISLWDCIVYSVIYGGTASLIVTFISGRADE